MLDGDGEDVMAMHVSGGEKAMQGQNGEGRSRGGKEAVACACKLMEVACERTIRVV